MARRSHGSGANAVRRGRRTPAVRTHVARRDRVAGRRRTRVRPRGRYPPAHPATAPTAPSTGDGFRADIQGLRGIAVLVVALGHAGVVGMGGGYVGVDVFFVISGFLITGWLLERALESGRVPFGDFYAARARRILPAAALTLVVTCAASVAYLNPVRAVSALHDALWAALFSANVRFAQVGTDYFAQDDPPSPIQHFWTLAVEEQFYLVWPLLLAAALLILRVRRRREGVSRAGLACLIALGVAASFAWSIHVTGKNSTSAYYSTPARAWELGVGALIAVGLPWILRIPTALRALLTWFGLVGIVAATVTFGPDTPFPGLAALLPVLAAGLVVAGGAGGAHRAGAAVVLSRQPLRLVGDVSYGFYLWHWPPLVIAAAYVGHPLSTLQNIVLLGIAFALSYVTYRLYENPLRHSLRLRRPRLALALWPASLSAVVLAAAVGVFVVATPGAAAPSLDASVAGERIGERFDATRPTVREALLESVSPARLRQPVPRALAPPLGELLSDRYRLGSCAAGAEATSARVCELGDLRARRRLVVLGDSHAAMWMPALVPFARRNHWRLVPLIKTGCVPAVMGSGSCAAWYQRALTEVGRLNPRVVVVAQAWSGWGQGGVDALARELQDLSSLTPRLVVVEDPPASGRATLDCLLARGATLGSCAFRVTPNQAVTYASVRREARAARAAYIPTLQWFCVQGLCPSVVGTIVTYRDRTHITATYARQLARPFGAAAAAATKR